MAESALHQKNWTNTQLFNLIFFTFASGIMSGLGFFYIEIIILDNALSQALFFALLVGISISTVYLTGELSKLAYKLEEGEINGK